MSEIPKVAFIVVGVDGSESSIDALRWAAEQAKRSGAELRVVSAWQWPTGIGVAADYSDVDFAGKACKVVDVAVDQALGTEPGLPVATEVRQGHPAAVLVEASRGAAMLVVGSRGHGAFTGMLLGSVSQHCAQHATCPVVIVRHQSE